MVRIPLFLFSKYLLLLPESIKYNGFILLMLVFYIVETPLIAILLFLLLGLSKLNCMKCLFIILSPEYISK